MKLHYFKILIFSLPLNILVSSSYANNKNKSYTTPQTRTITSRVLSECDLYMPNYDDDAYMKPVKEIFDRQTSERFKKYDELVTEKRKKCKEQCDKDIQQIIVKDKIQKSLAEKVEKGCLMCGCGLGGGVAPVWGLVSGLWYATWTQYVATKVFEAGITEGIKVAIEEIKTIYLLGNIPGINFAKLVTTENFNNINLLGHAVQNVSTTTCQSEIMKDTAFFCGVAENQPSVFAKGVAQFARTAAQKAGEAAKLAEATEAANFLPKTTILTNTIIASIVAIVVIVMILIIIYLILRYRRKKKMTKKLQYRTLLK
ncbi:hypothetical protein PFTANZ_02003 [Plasmodium falciparum Tanzania (2000708)]|uniref:Surface antigen n=1 Tax=Plasmodium falciparum Tanzania (2000708) TaxID=1036725 RepID=A0A024W9C4_PLAFA|nr:hypothetical protein PFTANZ_02003 [Plasmodium falciparum Tanzania (2000708)]